MEMDEAGLMQEIRLYSTGRAGFNGLHTRARAPGNRNAGNFRLWDTAFRAATASSPGRFDGRDPEMLQAVTSEAVWDPAALLSGARSQGVSCQGSGLSPSSGNGQVVERVQHQGTRAVGRS